jgi:hypothetical protein
MAVSVTESALGSITQSSPVSTTSVENNSKQHRRINIADNNISARHWPFPEE